MRTVPSPPLLCPRCRSSIAPSDVRCPACLIPLDRQLAAEAQPATRDPDRIGLANVNAKPGDVFRYAADELQGLDDPDDRMRTLLDVRDEMRQLLVASDVDNPVILADAREFVRFVDEQCGRYLAARRAARLRRGRRDLIKGLAWGGGGLALTYGGYVSADQNGGGTYLVFGGAIVVGAVLVVRALYYLVVPPKLPPN
jgi:hypothetical protein